MHNGRINTKYHLINSRHGMIHVQIKWTVAWWKQNEHIHLSSSLELFYMCLSMEFCVDRKGDMKSFSIQSTVLIVHIYKMYLKPSLPQEWKISYSCWSFIDKNALSFSRKSRNYQGTSIVKLLFNIVSFQIFLPTNLPLKHSKSWSLNTLRFPCPTAAVISNMFTHLTLLSFEFYFVFRCENVANLYWDFNFLLVWFLDFEVYTFNFWLFYIPNYF